MKHTRTKATSIPKEVKKEVYERDGHCCIFCGSPVDPYFANAHIIPRSHGGLGIPENIITLCQLCHYEFDNTRKRGVMMAVFKDYMRYRYKNYDEIQLVFKKGQEST